MPTPDMPSAIVNRISSSVKNMRSQAAVNGPLYEVVNAREYGGWGNLDFEFCMRQRG